MRFNSAVIHLLIVGLALLFGCESTTELEEKLPQNQPPQNQPPVISSLTADPATVEVSGTSTLTCLADDPDGDSLTYTWETSDGSITGSGGSVTWTAPSAPGAHSISCTVDDGNGGKDQRGATLTVVETVEVSGSITVKVVFENATKDFFSSMFGILWKGASWEEAGDKVSSWQMEETVFVGVVNGTYIHTFDEQFPGPVPLDEGTYYVGVEEWIPATARVPRGYYNANAPNTTSLTEPSGITIDTNNQSHSIEIYIR